MLCQQIWLTRRNDIFPRHFVVRPDARGMRRAFGFAVPACRAPSFADSLSAVRSASATIVSVGFAQLEVGKVDDPMMKRLSSRDAAVARHSRGPDRLPALVLYV